MSKQAIIEKILSDADAQARATIEEAEKKADEIISLAAEQCKSYLARNKSDIDRAVKEVAERAETVAELDARKLLLKAKSEVLDEVYALALKKAHELDKADYKKVVEGMLKFAEDGDKVTVSAREKGIVTKKMVDDAAKAKGAKLTLDSEYGDFDGGVLLTGNGIDKNFTFEVEFALLRDATEAKIAKELFG